MPNAIKYSVSAQTLALKKGNFWIGTGDVGKGPTSTTDYWNGITPPSGGYTIYLNKASQGPSIYVATNDSQLISLTNSIAGASYTTVNECLVYFAGQTDKMVVNREYEPIVTDGLVLNVDAGFTPSFPRSGTTWYDVSLSGNTGTLTNGPTFNSGDGGSIVFDGVNDYVDCSNSTSLQLTSAITVDCWFKAGTVGNFTTGAAKSNGQINGWTVQLRGATNEWRFWVNFGINTLGNGSNNGWYYASYPRNWNDGLWHNFIGIWDGSTKTVKLYIDSNQGTFNAGGAPSGESSNFSNYNGPVVLGRETDAGNFYNGNIANFKIYNRALSATEITQNFNAQKARFGL